MMAQVLAPVEEYESIRFKVLNNRDAYTARIRQYSGNGKEPPHSLPTGEVTVNSNPQLLPQHIQHVKDRFHQLKGAFLEQDVKHRFLQQLTTNDPPLAEVDQAEIEEIETQNAVRKAEIKKKKQQTDAILQQSEQLSQEVANEYEELAATGSDTRRLYGEIEQMKAEIAQLERELQDMEVPTMEDPEMNLPPESMAQLIDDYTTKTEEMTAQLRQVDTHSTEVESQAAIVEQEIAELTEKKRKEQAIAESLVKSRAQDLERGQTQVENAAKWHQSMISIVNSLTS